MPFGPVNGPATFIAFIHDMDSTWKALATELGLTINEDTNTNIIVDDILSWAFSEAAALLYMECQLRVCQSQNLSLSLKKSHIFPERFEFVGIDVCANGNRPAMSKHQLLDHWPTPIIIRDIAKFVGFMQFYSRFIPMFEVRITPLRELLREEYTMTIGAKWSKEAEAAWDDMRHAVLKDPCLRCFDHRKLLVLFLAEGMGYVACQPADDEASLSAMHRCLQGGTFDFMTKDSTAQLHPVAFGCRRTRGNEKRLHSHLGEAFAGDVAINKCRHMCFGQRFVWLTDCYALKFILSYDGRNAAILRLQMRFMCWDMIIEHRNDVCLTDADYFSRLGADLCYDPLLKEYIQQVHAFRRRSPAPTMMPIPPEHQPYFRGPRVNTPTPPDRPLPCTAPVPAPAAYSPTFANRSQHLANWPVVISLSAILPPSSCASKCLYNSDITRTTGMLARFTWAIYGFNSGQFLTSINDGGLPFKIVLACDPYVNGRALFRELTDCPTVIDGASALLDHIRASGITSPLSGYMSSTEPTTRFWDIQSNIVRQLHIIRSLSLVVAFVHPDHDGRSMSNAFVKRLSADGWIFHDTSVEYSVYGDTIPGTSRLIVGVHSNTEERCQAFELKTPPPTPPRPQARFIWAPFNRPDHALTYADGDKSFNLHAVNEHELPPVRVSPVSVRTQATLPKGVLYRYFLHRAHDNPSIVAGSAVVCVDGLCPPFDPTSNSNLFGHYFGMEFVHCDNTYVRSISPFEFARCFRLGDELTYKLSHPTNQFCLDAGIPALTSARIFEQIHEWCSHIRSQNFEIQEPNQFAAPAACVQTFLNGAIGVHFPDHDSWVRAYQDDPELRSTTLAQYPNAIWKRQNSARRTDRPCDNRRLSRKTVSYFFTNQSSARNRLPGFSSSQRTSETLSLLPSTATPLAGISTA